MEARAILCVQLQHFYARVAWLRQGSDAAGEMLAVTRESRVLDVSPEALAAGLRPGLRVREARRWFPQARFVPAVDEDYPEYARPVLDVCASYTPLVDPETPARIFLDVTGCEALYGSPEVVAGELARRIPAETGFPCAVGGGRSRLIAALVAMQNVECRVQNAEQLQIENFQLKIFNCSSPSNQSAICNLQSAIQVVPPDAERCFLAPLPLSRLAETLNPEMVEWLALRGVNTFGDVVGLPEGLLWRRFGVEGEKLIRLALGKDSTPVRPAYPPRRVEMRVECESLTPMEEEMAQYLTDLARRLAETLGAKRETARRFRLSLLLRDSRTLSNAALLPSPVGAMATIFEVLLRLFRKMALDEPPTEAMAVAEEFTAGEAFQGSLFPELEESPGKGAASPRQRQRERRLGHTLQLLAMRFGPTVVTPGCHLWVSRRPRFSDRVAMLGGGYQ